MRWLKRFLRNIVIFFFASTILAVVLYRFVPVWFTPLMGIRMVQQISNGHAPRCHHHWVSLSSMSDRLPLAVIASEDQRFMQHHGFDMDAIQKAAKHNKKGKKMRGGSTISQQTAKNVFLWPQRSWLRKGLESYFTVLIELLWPKERIMEVYLNSIEMGDGIYGAEAVSQAHFHKPAKDLTSGECALIAATLPNPLRYSSKNPGPYMQKRKGQILRQMRNVSFH